MPDAEAALKDGIDHLRVGSLARAYDLFGAAYGMSEDPGVRSEALRRQADVQRRWAEWDEALRLLEAAVRMAREHGLGDHEAAARNIEGTVHLQRGDFARAIGIFEAALALEPEARQRGLISQNLGTAFAQQGDHEAAARWYARSSGAFGDAGCPREQILALINQGSVRLDQVALPDAAEIFRDALARAQGLPGGDLELQALAEVNLAESLARQRTGLEEAHDLVLRATGHFTASRNQPLRVACHRVFALIAEAQGHAELAREALGQGLRLAREIESATEVAQLERELERLGDEPARSSTSIECSP